MGALSGEAVKKRPLSNYRIRFRHGVYPNAEGEATRADIKKYDYFFSSEQTWIQTPGDGMFAALPSHGCVADALCSRLCRRVCAGCCGPSLC
jgi:hypothetical protein